MPSWMKSLRKSPKVIFQVPVDESRCYDPNEFRLPTNPKNVKLQESEPRSLPAEDANVHVVRFFLYHVLTFRGNRVAKRWPQWVLETVSYWKGDGKVLRSLEGDLTYLCPMSAGYAQLDSKVLRESSPSGDCRTEIGLVLSTYITKLKEGELRSLRAHEEWLAAQRGSNHPWLNSMTSQPDLAIVHSPSRLRRPDSRSTAYPSVHQSSAVSDTHSARNVQAAYPVATEHVAPSVIRRYGIPHAASISNVRGQATSGINNGSRHRSPPNLGECSTETYMTYATKLSQSRSSAEGGRGIPIRTTRSDIVDSSTVNQDFFSCVSRIESASTEQDFVSCASDIKPSSQYKSISSASPGRQRTTQEPLWSNRNQDGSMGSPEHSNPISSRGSSRYPLIDYYGQGRFPSSPDRYRGGRVRTAGTLSRRSSMNFSRSAVSGLRDERSSIGSTGSSYKPVDPSIIHASPPGLVCGQRRASFQQSVRSGAVSGTSPTSSHDPYPQNSLQGSTQGTVIPTVDYFAGPLRSANNASLDTLTLASGEDKVLYEQQLQMRGISSQSRRQRSVQRIPGDTRNAVQPSTRIFNMNTGQPFLTLYERIEHLEQMGKLGKDRS